MATPEFFLLSVSGEISTAQFSTCDNLWCNYCFSYGTDWAVTSGVEEGMTQTVMKAVSDSDSHVLNFPLEIAFKSSNPYGWPQLVLHCYGSDVFGHDSIKGYGSCHVPLQPGRHNRRIGMFVPESSSQIMKFNSWLLGKQAYFVNPRIVADGEGRDVAKVKSQGVVEVVFNVILKNMGRLGYSYSKSSA